MHILPRFLIQSTSATGSRQPCGSLLLGIFKWGRSSSPSPSFLLFLLVLLVVVAGETPHDIHSSQGAVQNVLFHSCQLNKLPPQTNVKSLEAVKIAGCSSF